MQVTESKLQENKSETFPTLYGIDKNNKIKRWDISVETFGEYSVVTYNYGYLGGKQVECKMTIDSGKNLGKKNETTHYEQAVLVSQSKWKKKRDTDGYITDLEKVNKTVENRKNSMMKKAGGYLSGEEIPQQEDKSEKETVFPMLAKDYKKNIKKIKFPAYIQPKLDGYRMIFDGRTGSLTTRTGRKYVSLSGGSLERKLLEISKKYDIILDGELYVHDNDFKFENLGVLKKTNPLNEKEVEKIDKIKYHVYDIVDLNVAYENRQQRLQDIFNKLSLQDDTYYSKHIVLVESYLVHDETEIDTYHNRMIENGFEGSIIRNKTGLYKCKYRSSDLLKYKNFDDGEFEIIGYDSEKNVSIGSNLYVDDTSNKKDLVVWLCKTDDNKKFHVRPKGTINERSKLYKNADMYIGRKLWVKFFGLTERGVPRFPTTARDSIKEYIRDIII